MPASHRFDLKARAAVKRGIQTTYVSSLCLLCLLQISTYFIIDITSRHRQFTVAFGIAYPILGGLFFQSGIFIQALLIPVFFIVRAGFEYVVFER